MITKGEKEEGIHLKAGILYTAVYKRDNQEPTIWQRNSTQYFVVTYKGKESKKNVYITVMYYT